MIPGRTIVRLLSLGLVSILTLGCPQHAHAFLSSGLKKLIREACESDGIKNRWDTFDNDLLQYAISEDHKLLKTAITDEQIEVDGMLNDEYERVLEQFAVTDLFTTTNERVTPDPPNSEMWLTLKEAHSQDTTTELDMTFTYSLVLREKLAAYNQLLHTYEEQANDSEIDFRGRLRLQNRLDSTENQLLAIRSESNRHAMCQRIEMAEERERIRQRMERRASEQKIIESLMP